MGNSNFKYVYFKPLISGSSSWFLSLKWRSLIFSAHPTTYTAELFSNIILKKLSQPYLIVKKSILHLLLTFNFNLAFTIHPTFNSLATALDSRPMHWNDFLNSSISSLVNYLITKSSNLFCLIIRFSPSLLTELSL